MSFIKSIQSKIENALKPASLEIVNESHLHAGHQEKFDGSGETHLRIRVVSDAFTGKSRVDRHRMINEFRKMAEELDNQIHLEEEKSGITDINHFAYPTFAKAARQRRDNLEVSIRELEDKREAAEQALSDAEEELKKAQRLENRDSSGAAEGAVDEQVERRAIIG